MKREDHIDFFIVPDGQLTIHERLESWARWVKVRPQGWQIAPMFQQYRSKAWQWERPEVKAQTNIPDALEIEKLVSLLPCKNRDAIRWNYVFCNGPLNMARRLGVSKQGLSELVCAGRIMLRNQVRHR